MPIYELSASWWVGAAVMASFVIFTPEGVFFFFFFFFHCNPYQTLSDPIVHITGLPIAPQVRSAREVRFAAAAPSAASYINSWRRGQAW